MTQTFGRRTAPSYHAPVREPAIPHEVQQALAAVRRPQQDPEFAAWTRARAMTRWKIWGMCFLIVLGGPLAFFLPEGVGRIAGIASTTIGITGMVLRWMERPPTAEPRRKRSRHQSDRDGGFDTESLGDRWSPDGSGSDGGD
ncbi:MAG: hypothetical protein CFE28_13210 [Alphaproteobacteria bacterium PA2]|nr:MAG: hypothetical protein CFE28_13210 [Alphaproteobacteria bacterium PA2]